MRRFLIYIPVVFTLVLTGIFAWHGPIFQLANYHAFADQSNWLGIDHAMDVLSNLGFLAVGSWALFLLFGRPDGIEIQNKPALAVFALSVLATAWCSSYYHLAPDDARLFWDRLPIAVACASLLSLVRSACLVSPQHPRLELIGLCIFAVASVCWWQQTGDLRPYLSLQILAIALPPVWQWLYGRPKAERIWFAVAIAFYVVAKCVEMADGSILSATTMISGHTIKHVLAACAAYFIVKSQLKQARVLVQGPQLAAAQ